MDFPIGTIVKLTPDGPEMKVAAPPDPTRDGWIWCVFFDKEGIPQAEFFDPQLLVKVEG